MPKSSWSVLAQESKSHHLVVVQVPAGLADDPQALIGRLIEELAPVGTYALTAQKETASTTVFCAFGLGTDADQMIDVLNAQEDNLHLGWASEHHCVIDKSIAEAIAGLVPIVIRPPGDPAADPALSSD
jgi:hypothetical protein